MYNLYHLIGVFSPISFLNKSFIVHELIYNIFRGLWKNFNNNSFTVNRLFNVQTIKYESIKFSITA